MKYNNSTPGGGMTIATTTFLKLNQSHFNQGDYMPTPSPIVTESSDFYQHHHFPYHFVSHHQYFPHMHCDHHNNYGTTSSSSAKTRGQQHTYQTIGPSTISSSSAYSPPPEHHYAKPDNMGNIEIIDSKRSQPHFDEMNNELH
jgi:hypothetical protein